MDKTKIIVVEDNIVYCEFVCNMLSREGYRTVKAYHLSTAKKHLQQATDNDIVVADLRLPDGNGIDLLRWMRKEGKMQPFIIMTDYAEVHTAVESMKLGSIDYIPKQFAGVNYTGENLYMDEPAVRAGNIITANGFATLEFCREILYALEADSSQKIERSYRMNKTGVWEDPEVG